MNQRLQLILTNLVIIATVVGLLYWFLNKAESDIRERIDTVNLNFKYSKGVIEDIKYYKGHSVEVKYIINDRIYEFSGGWDKNPQNLAEGDSIKFRYSVDNPELIITELENEY